MNEYCLDLRHRPRVQESIAEKHKIFCNTLKEFDFPWGYKGHSVPNIDVKKPKIVYVVKLKELSPRGLRSYLTYSLRSDQYLRDVAEHDDGVIIEFKPKDLDLSFFVKEVFPRYIESFDCYRASVINRELSRDDWTAVSEKMNSTGKDVDGRDGVYRVNEINFYDRELCKRAFSLTPEKIVERLEGKVESVYLFHDGVVLIYSSTLLPIDQLEEVDGKVRRWLGCK